MGKKRRKKESGQRKKKKSAQRKKWGLGLLGIVALVLVVVFAYPWRGSPPYIIQDNRGTIEGTEFRFSPADLQATPGELTLSLVNRGRISHALAIQGPGVQATTRVIGPGQRATLKVRLRQMGKYKLICPLRGHVARGMVGSLRVVAKQGGKAATGG